MTELGRTHLDLHADVAFSEIEIMMFADFATIRRSCFKDLAQASALVVTMGGYLHGKTNKRLGDEIMHNGHSALSFSAWLCGLSLDLKDKSALHKYKLWDQDVTCV
ncbi:MAG: hypothetical protein OXC62_17200 [Aestuariivita sp.]|nr:hypothetical protein [Aestuariivita sp.]